MRVVRMTLHRLQLPLRSVFEHAASARTSTDNVICELELDGGMVGYGEGVPRRYVTGEEPEDCWETLSAVPAELFSTEVASLGEAIALVEQLAAAIPDTGSILRNASRSALELAILDAFSRGLCEALLPAMAARLGGEGVPATPRLAYSLIVGKQLAADPPGLMALRDEFGYRAIKLKVGFGLETDLSNIARLREVFGPTADIRLDANRALEWSQSVELLRSAAQMNVRAIEDPLRGDTVDELLQPLRRLRDELGAEIILDEPIRTEAEAGRAARAGALDVVNVRISKCGGLLRSLAIAAVCARHGVSVQLGCQVGETAILSAAGRLFALAVGSARYLEGSNERLKFASEHFLSAEDLTYGLGGLGAPLAGPGLGITVLPDRLARLASRHLELRSPRR